MVVSRAVSWMCDSVDERSSWWLCFGLLVESPDARVVDQVALFQAKVWTEDQGGLCVLRWSAPEGSRGVSQAGILVGGQVIVDGITRTR